MSIKNIVEKEKLEYGIILSMNNLNCSNSKIKFIPLYMTMFIKINTNKESVMKIK